MTRTIWNKIFKEDTWLDKALDQGHRPFLLGTDLFKLQNREVEPWNFDIALLFEPKLKNMKESDWHALLETMQPHSLFQNEVRINIEGGYCICVHLPEFPDYDKDWYTSTTPVYPKSLLKRWWNEPHMVNSAYTYWDDDINLTQKVVRRFSRDDIESVTQKDLGTICKISMQDPNSQLNKYGFEKISGKNWLLEIIFQKMEDGYFGWIFGN